MKVKNLIPAVLVALALSATLALADYYFEGNGYGACGELHPWGNWQGYIETDAMEYNFYGDWWCGGNTGDIVGFDLTYNAQYGCYYMDEGTWDCDQNSQVYGYWSGYFCPGSDTADGDWWMHDWSCYGTFWGNNAD